MLLLYRLLVFVISALVHYCGFFALLWFGQIFVGVGSYAHFDIAEIGVIAAVLQVAAFVILISPLGYIFQKSCYPVRRLSMREEEKLLPLLDDIMLQYKEQKNSRIRRVRLFMMDDTQENASAFGKNNIAITTGLLNRLKWRDAALKGVLAHELGHLHHRDLWFWHYVDAVGGIFSLLFGILGLAQRVANAIADLFLPAVIVSLPLQIMHILFSYGVIIMRLPADLLAKLEPYLSRSIEYRADKFSADLLGADGMLSFLNSLAGDEVHMEFGFLNMKSRSHPPSELRLEKLFMHPSYEPYVPTKPVVKIERKINKPKIKANSFKNNRKNYIPL